MVGDTWPDRLADGATTGPPNARDQRARDRMRRHAHRDGVEAGGGEIGDRAGRGFRQHERQRPRPERGGERVGRGVEDRERARGRARRRHGRSAD